MPRAEVLLWSRLRGRQAECKFRRQYGVGPYVIDFYSTALKLAIEIDGDSHSDVGAEERDAQRQAFIESHGIRVVRFTNEDVYKRLEDVLDEIVRVTAEIKKNSPTPL